MIYNVAETPRAELRFALAAQWSMNLADHYRRCAVFSEAAHKRFTRLWAVSTATEHPYTRSWSLDRWRLRRERVRNAIRKAVET